MWLVQSTEIVNSNSAQY